MYGSGIEIPRVAFSSLDFSQITAGSFFLGFDINNAGKLSKINSLGVITVIEGTGGSGVVDVGAGTDSSIRISNNNTSLGDCSTVFGFNNDGDGDFSVIGGGSCNIANINHSTVSGGYTNTASGLYFGASTVAGGALNTAASDFSTVGGGGSNSASNVSTTVSGGYANTASGSYSTIGGGWNNIASFNFTTVAGGVSNTSSGYGSTISGGRCNTSSGYYSTLGGGLSNTASGDYATIAGGRSNQSAAPFSAILGGCNNTISASYCNAMIAGSNISAVASDTLHANCLWLGSIATEAALPLPNGTVYKCSSTGVLYIA